MCQPVGTLIVGALAGLLSVLGYKYITVIPSFFIRSRYKYVSVFSVQGKKITFVKSVMISSNSLTIECILKHFLFVL